MSVRGITIPSFFDGVCSMCGGEIITGEYIVYLDDEAWVHEDCTYTGESDWETNA